MLYAFTNGQDPDFTALCVLLEESLEEAVGATVQRSQYKSFNTTERIGEAVIVYDAAVPVACGGFRPYEEGTAEVKRVFVKKEYRGRGISKQLMLMLEGRAREQGYDALVLETNGLLVPAVSLYKSLGYSVIENYGPYKDMEASVCMKKVLREGGGHGTARSI